MYGMDWSGSLQHEAYFGKEYGSWQRAGRN